MKYFYLFFLISLNLFGADGASVYKQHCASCHQTSGMMQGAAIKAPAMQMVSMRLKQALGSKETFVTFVDDYIQNPSRKKGYCMPMAYERFGTMPAIGKGLSKEERLAVAAWLYDAFEGNWNQNHMNNGRSCGPSCGNCNRR